jgi:hypothetical protein
VGAKLTHAAVIGFSIIVMASVLNWTRAGQGQQPRKVPQWEYEAVAFSLAHSAEENTKKLNDLAAEGWDYAGPLTTPAPSVNWGYIAFKRQKQ